MKSFLRLITALLLIPMSHLATAQSGTLPVTVQLNWNHQFEFAAFYAAIEKGYYSNEGLQVTLKEGGPGIDMVKEVLSGHAQFGVSNSSLLIDRYRDKPVVAVGVLMQHSAIALLGNRARGINTVEDLDGKRVQCPPHACDEIKAYLKASGLDISRVKFEGFSSKSAIERLEVAEATEVYSSNDGFHIIGQQNRFVLMLPRSAGIDLYGNVLFTSDEILRTRADLVDRFRKATFMGLQYAMTHHEEMTNLILSKYNTQGKSRAQLEFEADRLTELTRTDLVEPGYMNKGRWNHVRDTFAELGLLPLTFDLDDFLYIPNPSAVEIARLNRRLIFSIGLLLVVGGGGIYIFLLQRKLARTNANLVEANSRLTHLAHYDELTQVPNRVLIYDRLAQGLKQAQRNKIKLAFMVIDLDGFKPVNDMYGHHVGDQVLQEVAKRLQNAIRKVDTVGRFGGDEFVVLLTEIDSDSSAMLVAEKAREAVKLPIYINDLTIGISMSAGIAIYPDHGSSESELLKNADTAMYQAKAQGRHQVVFFQPGMTLSKS